MNIYRTILKNGLNNDKYLIKMQYTLHSLNVFT